MTGEPRSESLPPPSWGGSAIEHFIDAARGNEFVFRGDRNDLWEMVSLFVDEESVCCPFYNYEQRETDQGVSLLVGTPPVRVELQGL